MSIFIKKEYSPHILVIQHSDQAACSNFCKALNQRDCQITTLHPLKDDSLPTSPADYDGLVVLGGPQHATDDFIAPHFPALMDLMRQFDLFGKPVAGICLGCQLLARAYREQPRQLGFLEIGFVQHTLTNAAKEDPLFSSCKLPPLMEFHEDTFSLPQDATLLVEGTNCPNQCFRIGKASYGFQFHLEVDESTVRDWLNLFQKGKMDSYESYRASITEEKFTETLDDLGSYIHDSEIFCEQIATRWLSLVQKHRSPVSPD